jgi:hypothetical protein
VAAQADEIAELKSRVADLEERLGRNPRDSSMPPSAELFTKPPSPSRAERRAAAKKQGKQPGALGKHLAQRVDPDIIVTHVPDVCGSLRRPPRWRRGGGRRVPSGVRPSSHPLAAMIPVVPRQSQPVPQDVRLTDAQDRRARTGLILQPWLLSVGRGSAINVRDPRFAAAIS